MLLSKKASVIIVTYNHRDYLSECLNSVLSNDPLEVIVVDNGSTDQTDIMVSSSFPTIKYLVEKK